ncbi:MAG: GPR endopeptidase [Lachnospiraceae bacterium]|nr:GPR endopeptidase [Lachnospiraceae bacterium]
MSNLDSFRVRTDLALEARENIEVDAERLHGVKIFETYDEKSEVRVTKVVIETKNGSKVMGKPIGTYVTLEAPAMIEPDENYHKEISQELAGQIREIIPGLNHEQSILVIGLGNRDVTPDALGPNVVDNLIITRHMVREYGKAAFSNEEIHVVSGIVPGVMAKTGMEAAEITQGIIDQTKPDIVIVIDALAARSTRRLNRTIQITDTGIHPGSGVGNHRNALTEENLGVPVIAIGVPTVVDAATIVGDAVDKALKGKVGDHIEIREEMLNSLGELRNMYVTGKDVDFEIKQISHIVCDAINIALNLSY